MADPRFHCLSLFSGVGMLDEGVRLAVPGARTVAYVERDAYAAAVLMARMEDAALEPAPVFCGDIERFDARPFAGLVDCVTAGFPCQPWSVAGTRGGASDERWLWSDIERVLGEVQPRWVFLENVPGLLRGGLGLVLGGLHRLGFDAEWCCLSASACGASHKRNRVFVLAHARSQRRQQIAGSASCDESADAGREANADHQPASEGEGLADARKPGREGRERPVAFRPEHGEKASPSTTEFCEPVAHAERPERRALDGSRRTGREHDDAQGQEGAAGPRISNEAMGDAASRGARPTGESSQCERRAGASSEGLGDAASERKPAAQFAGLPPRPFPPGPNDADGWAEVLDRAPHLEPAVCKLAHGLAPVMADRVDSLRAIGNGVVPIQAAAAFTILARRFGDI